MMLGAGTEADITFDKKKKAADAAAERIFPPSINRLIILVE